MSDSLLFIKAAFDRAGLFFLHNREFDSLIRP
jgi:hypothetical protein